jgi:hypothetical protein
LDRSADERDDKMQGDTGKRANSGDEAEERPYRRIIDAMDRGDIDDFAAAIGQVADPPRPAPASHPGPNKRRGLWTRLCRLAGVTRPERQA